MKYNWLVYAAILSCVAALAAGQLMFKMLSNRITSLMDILVDPQSLGLFLTAASLYAASTLAWILVLRVVPLSQAYLFISLGFVLVPAFSYLVLGETITARYVIGSLLVIVGIWLAAT